MHDHFNHSHGPQDGGLEFEPLDTANQSLADALRVSFKILKLVLVVVVFLYLISGFQTVEQNEMALVLRLGKLEPNPLQPGLVATFPRPIDELIKVPVLEKRTTTVVSQDLHVKEGEDRASVRRSGGLDPALDGAIMTGDRGLVHGRWIVTYEIDDLAKFVTTLHGAAEGAEIPFIKHAVENAAISVIGELQAVDVVRNKIGFIQQQIKLRAQRTLSKLETGIKIAHIDAIPSWPVQTKRTFEQVTQASNEKRKTIDEAKQHRIEILNATAGAAHAQLEELFSDHLAAKSAGDTSAADTLMAEIEDVILHQATGLASETIRDARSHKKKILEDVKADALEYRGYLAEYRRNPEMLFRRLWYDAQESILTNPKVSKRHLPSSLPMQLRLTIGPDPKEKEAREEAGLKAKSEVKGIFAPVERSKGRSRSTGRAQVLH